MKGLADARTRSRLRSVVAATCVVRRDRDGVLADSGHAASAQAAARLLDQELCAGTADPVDLGRLLTRSLTLVQLSSSAVASTASSMPVVVIDGDLATAIASSVRELLYAFECTASPSDAASLYLAGEWDGMDLTLALACPEAARAPVASASGLAAIARADLLVALAGGTMVHGVSDGRALFALAFRLDWKASHD